MKKSNTPSTKTLNQRTYYAQFKDVINERRRKRYHRRTIICPIHQLRYHASKSGCEKCRSKDYFKIYRKKNKSKLNENSLRYYHNQRKQVSET